MSFKHFWHLDCYNFCYILKKNCKVILVRSLTQVSENTPKIISIGSRITEKLPFKKLEILSFLAPFISKIKTADIFNFLSVKYFGKGLLFLKFWLIRVNYCWNYGPSNLLFRFFRFRLGHLSNRQTKIAENSTIYFLKANTKTSVWWKFQVLWPTHHKMTVL